MRTSTQTTGRVDLASIASTLSKDVERHLAATQQAAQEALRRRAAQEAARTRARNREEARKAALIGPRIELARKGLARILELGRSDPVVQILNSLGRLNYEFVQLADFSRPSGDWWDRGNEETPDEVPATREVTVALYPDRVELYHGAWHLEGGRDGFAWAFGHDSSITTWNPAGVDKLMTSTLDEFWEEIATPYPTNLSFARRWKQRTCEWDPEAVLFEFLVSCARKARFEKYVKDCMSRLTSVISG